MESLKQKQNKNEGGNHSCGQPEGELSGASARDAEMACSSEVVALKGSQQLSSVERGSCDNISLLSHDESEADSSRLSECSVSLERLPSKFWKKTLSAKRRRTEERDAKAGSSEEEAPDNLSTPNDQLGRGQRLPKAQSELYALKREQAERKAEEDVAVQMKKLTAKRVVAPLVRHEDNSALAHDLNKQVLDAADIIVTVAKKSTHLKGTFAKALKDAAASIKVAVEALYANSVTEETAKLHAEVTRLRAEMAELRKELAARKTREEQEAMEEDLPPVGVKRPAADSNQEDLARMIMLQVGSMINARLEGLEERLLPEKRIRPPLAADQRQKTAPASNETGQNSSDPNKGKKGKNKKSAAETLKPQVSQQKPTRESPKKHEEANEGWTTVTKRGKKAKKTVPNQTGTKQPGTAKHDKRPVVAKLRAPRTAAVVITLQPGAEAKGVTYATLISEAKKKVDISSCGITSLRFRKAATGARIMEVAGGESSVEKADSFAQKLKEALGEEYARVSRPTKCAEFRILGLDDSVTKADLVAAIAQRGGCPEDSIKVGDIKCTQQGTGTAFVSCPVAATKKLGAEGRLLVGWVSARVELVQPRAMRCYRCHQNGHVRAQCTEEIDRSEECYRCGQPGHKSSACSAQPKCSLCAAANRPSAHRLGSKTCAPPKPRRKRAGNLSGPTTAATSCPPSQVEEEAAEMETT